MDYETRFSELKALIEACNDLATLRRTVRALTKAADAGTLGIPSCDGAIAQFAQERTSALRAGMGRTSTVAEARERRILTIHDSSGGRRGRRS